MNKKDKYCNILEVALSKASQALSDNDFEKVSESMDIIAESYGKYKEIKKAEDTLRNADFATLRRVFENAIPKLFVSKSKALKEITNVIREDKNLIGQFRFIDAMRRFNNSSDSNSYVCESIDLACRNIDAKGVSKSNEKLAEATRELKETEKGVDTMCRILEEMCNEVEAKAIRNVAFRLFRNGSDYQTIIAATDMPYETIDEWYKEYIEQKNQ